MKMYRVEDNQIVQYSVSKTLRRLDGTTVSGYNLLPYEELKKDGWLPVEENIPPYNENTQYIVEESTEILENKIIVNYRVEDIVIPDQEPTELEKATSEIWIELSEREINEIIQGRQISDLEIQILEIQLGGM